MAVTSRQLFNEDVSKVEELLGFAMAGSSHQLPGCAEKRIAVCMVSVNDSTATSSEGFEDLTWLFTCDSRNRGLIAEGFNEAAILWKAAKATAGNILEIGRKRAGSTVILAAAAPGRTIYSVDLRLRPHPRCKEFLERSGNRERVQLRVGNSREPLPGVLYGLLFIDGDHSFEGLLADVLAHWNALETTDGKPGLAAFHDALPNDNFKWRDADRRLNRFLIRLKNKFRKRQKAEVAPDYEPGVLRVCEELIRRGLASKWGSAGSMLVLRKLAPLPGDFAELARIGATG
ncbi:MAG: class I SAM-dependent methyltransferase [Verrucomicrobia bacterium]|nr:class I SAM-dependent methyltransferase [Verrucomicrobiota bacterium]